MCWSHTICNICYRKKATFTVYNNGIQNVGDAVILSSLSFLVIDADSIARQRLLASLSDIGRRFHLQPCESVTAAQSLVSQCHFDVWFMDIDLPGISGFGFIDDQLKQSRPIPPIVFTTSHKDFALRAFDYPVLDYLLKPLSNARVAKTIEKLNKLQCCGETLTQPDKSKLAPIAINNDQIIEFKNGSSWLRLPNKEVLWIEAAGDYMCVHTSTENHILRSTLKQLETQLYNHEFIKINRSALVNWSNVVSCKPAKNGNYQITLVDQTTLRISRKHRVALEAWLSQSMALKS